MLNFAQAAIPVVKNYTVKLYNEDEQVKVPSGSMVITIDLSKDEYPLTKAGKSLSIASSHGFDNISGTTLGLSLNVTSKMPS